MIICELISLYMFFPFLFFSPFFCLVLEGLRNEGSQFSRKRRRQARRVSDKELYGVAAGEVGKVGTQQQLGRFLS